MPDIPSTPSKDTRHIRRRQKAVFIAEVGGCIAFALVGLNAFFNLVPQEYVMFAAIAALFLAIGANVFLSSAKCPNCGETFIGNSVPDDGGPEVVSSTTQCRYCAHPL